MKINLKLFQAVQWSEAPQQIVHDPPFLIGIKFIYLLEVIQGNKQTILQIKETNITIETTKH